MKSNSSKREYLNKIIKTFSWRSILSVNKQYNALSFQGSRKLYIERVGKKLSIMKKTVFSLTLLLFVIKSFSQVLPSPSLKKDYYLQKSKNQKKAGWILLTAGTIMVVGGAVAFDKSRHSGSNSATDISGFIILAGIVSDIVSIPFFISASENKAFPVAINCRRVQQKAFASNTQPTLTLRVGLRNNKSRKENIQIKLLIP